MTSVTRSAGILLHPTSLPGPGSIGTLGPDAYRFVDLLRRAGARRWQILPLTSPRDGGSPYDARSSFAGNELLISARMLHESGLLPAEPGTTAPGDPGRADFAAARSANETLLRAAFANLPAAAHAAVAAYRESQAGWLEDYALYCAIKRSLGDRAWTDWPAELRTRDSAALAAARGALADDVALTCFAQWCFDEQWARLRAYARDQGVSIIGDVPIFPARDSADVWAAQDLFKLDDLGRPLVVTGVPPDYFSETGQLWGNPHYDWPRHAADGFAWWRERFAQTFRRVDIVRVDHFRAFAAAWEVPAGALDARVGNWVEGPGMALFAALGLVGSDRVIAEDLGIITDDVRELRRAAGFPGMKVLQFAFDSDARNEHLPHNHEPRMVAYTGTHDNTTTVAWAQSLTPAARAHVADYLGADASCLPDALIRAAVASVAETAIIPMQDALALGAGARMNTPAELDGNWAWRFAWEQVDEARFDWLAGLAGLYGRA